MLPLVLDTRALRRHTTGQLSNLLPFSDKTKEKTQHVAWKDTTDTYAKTHQVVKSQGLRCGDIELAAYLTDTVGPVNLVLELRIAHERRE